MDHDQDIEAGKGSLRPQIDISTIFYPQIVIDTPKSPPQIISICETPKSRPQVIIATPESPNFPSGPKIYAPEKKLTLFALRLAVLEKAATGLGALGFIWATVVLLGGFAVKLAKADFWFITIILLIEGARIFSRSHELEWQRHETTSVKAACFQLIRMVSKQNQQSSRGRNSIHRENSQRKWDQKKMPTRTWNIADVPILPFSEGVFQSKYVRKVLFWLQLASGAMESISSLLQSHRTSRGLADESPKIIDFTHVEEGSLKDEGVTSAQNMTMKRALQVLKRLASTTGTTGKQLRNEISEGVFTISNIRDILKYGEKQAELQQLGIEILTSLAMEADTRENIGGTGGVLKELVNIFFKEGMPFLRKNAARILKNLCIYIGEDCSLQLRGVINAAPVVLRAIMSEENKLQEVMVGLAANVFKFMTSEESSKMFEKAGTQEAELARALVQILRKYQNPTIDTPRIRRFVIELAIWMMRHKEASVQIFKGLGMRKEMESVIETTSQIENFNFFSGAIGRSPHSTSMHSLVETAMKLLE